MTNTTHILLDLTANEYVFEYLKNLDFFSQNLSSDFSPYLGKVFTFGFDRDLTRKIDFTDFSGVKENEMFNSKMEECLKAYLEEESSGYEIYLYQKGSLNAEPIVFNKSNSLNFENLLLLLIEKEQKLKSIVIPAYGGGFLVWVKQEECVGRNKSLKLVFTQEEVKKLDDQIHSMISNKQSINSDWLNMHNLEATTFPEEFDYWPPLFSLYKNKQNVTKFYGLCIEARKYYSFKSLDKTSLTDLQGVMGLSNYIIVDDHFTFGILCKNSETVIFGNKEVISSFNTKLENCS